MDRITYLLVAVLIAGGLSRPGPVAAASLPTVRLVGPVGLIRAGDTVTVQVHVDSAGRLINTVDLHLAYNASQVQLLRVDRQENIWTLWPEAPNWSNQLGQVSMAAGRPRGVVAVDATVASLVFRVLAPGVGQVSVRNDLTGVYLNDGQGTRVPIAPASPLELLLADALVPNLPLDSATNPTPDAWTATGEVHVRWTVATDTKYSYQFSTSMEEVPDDLPEDVAGRADYPNLDDGVYFFTIKSRVGDGVWSRISQYRFLLDRQPPEAFTLTPLTAADTHGQAAVSWTVVDATSGVVSTRLHVGRRDLGAVSSPQTIQPGWRGQELIVSARDGAGNERRASWRVPGRSIWIDRVVAGLALALTVGGAIWIAKRQRSR